MSKLPLCEELVSNLLEYILLNEQTSYWSKAAWVALHLADDDEEAIALRLGRCTDPAKATAIIVQYLRETSFFMED